ncbi:hypothetical protein [Treponema sp. C6A8]|uniref:hypothetical protein n=1 Tax=Treponema sp. C6A8 TaxID=1410609 RepID=UPI00048A3CE2|nr:hypothetical protein [Treponema sp. C6A8]
MSKEIIFKQCSEKDVAFLSEIGAKTFEETFAAENSKEDMEEYQYSSPFLDLHSLQQFSLS